ncbi:unnamed protein product [Periconia digitata]|uniref:Uncharacterized protein n=1 Tax=Periconia digitata TaxID=1303443 RepID=A0A9W4UNZ5_9PLEO|nr:unnamed protein product [Periconia digitata]
MSRFSASSIHSTILVYLKRFRFQHIWPISIYATAVTIPAFAAVRVYTGSDMSPAFFQREIIFADILFLLAAHFFLPILFDWYMFQNHVRIPPPKALLPFQTFHLSISISIYVVLRSRNFPDTFVSTVWLLVVTVPDLLAWIYEFHFYRICRQHYDLRRPKHLGLEEISLDVHQEESSTNHLATQFVFQTAMKGENVGKAKSRSGGANEGLATSDEHVSPNPLSETTKALYSNDNIRFDPYQEPSIGFLQDYLERKMFSFIIGTLEYLSLDQYTETAVSKLSLFLLIVDVASAFALSVLVKYFNATPLIRRTFTIFQFILMGLWWVLFAALWFESRPDSQWDTYGYKHFFLRAFVFGYHVLVCDLMTIDFLGTGWTIGYFFYLPYTLFS